jgi:hypothetical protein
MNQTHFSFNLRTVALPRVGAFAPTLGFVGKPRWGLDADTRRHPKYSQCYGTTVKLFFFLTFLAFAPFAQALDLSQVPKPPVPARDAGDYYTQLEKMRVCLSQNRKYDFYKEAERLSVIIEANQIIRRAEKRPIKTREDFVAIEWKRYYVVTAPVITEKDIANGMPWLGIVKSGIEYSESFDLDSKYVVFTSMETMSEEEYEELSKILKKDIKEVKEIHFAYLVALIKSMKAAKENTIRASLDFEKEIRQKKESNTAGKVDFIRKELFRLGRRQGCAEIHSDRMSFYFAVKLIQTFPKDGGAVQKHLFSIGCSKEECRMLLDGLIERNKETEHFFRGLPPKPQRTKSSTTKK